MAIIRGVVVLHHKSGLARDNAANTYHFEGDPTTPHLSTIRDALLNMYTVGQANSKSIAQFLANHMDSITVKLYDVTDEPSGPPLVVSAPMALTAQESPTDLPSEVACCLSFEGTPAAGLVQSRRRGRVFIGPLNTNARTGESATGAARPAPLFTETLRQAGSKLAADVDAAAEMVVYSRPFAGRPAGRYSKSGKPLAPLAAREGFTVGVDRFWTDDAFDTQRRRGERALTKTYLTSAG